MSAPLHPARPASPPPLPAPGEGPLRAPSAAPAPGAAARTLLLTPGPLTTAPATRAAMAADWGSRDPRFVAMSEGMRARLLAVSELGETHVAVPIQGSGTFAVEAALGTLVPRDGRLLVLVNGAYGRRMVAIARRIGRDCAALEFEEDQAVDPDALDRALRGDPTITDVALVHCETTSGLLNPLGELARVVERHGRALLLDSMSGFGALPLEGARPRAVMASSNKCLEGVPGIGVVLAERAALAGAEGWCHSLALDLHAQWRGFEADGQWRFTPPVQVVAALAAALEAHAAEGGVPARGARYRRNRDVLLEGMTALGFEPYLAPAVQGPIIVTFRTPGWLDFSRLYGALAERGVVLYPGKLTRAESFRIGCIGDVDEADMRRCVEEVGRFLGR